MRNLNNVNLWLDGAPQEVHATCERLMSEIATMRGTQTIYPAQDDILNALAYTAPGDVRAVILGQDPYHEPGQAMGLSFSVPQGQKLPPSLRNIYKEMAADLGCETPKSGDLTRWAEQGVLLLNTTLTVAEHAANSHSKLGWQVLTHYLVEKCFTLPQPVVFLAWGRFAVGLVEEARLHAGAAAADTLGNKFVLASTHPSPLSASRSSAGLPAFLGSRPFSQTNKLLEGAGAQAIDWEHVG